MNFNNNNNNDQYPPGMVPHGVPSNLPPNLPANVLQQLLQQQQQQQQMNLPNHQQNGSIPPYILQQMQQNGQMPPQSPVQQAYSQIPGQNNNQAIHYPPQPKLPQNPQMIQRNMSQFVNGKPVYFKNGISKPGTPVTPNMMSNPQVKRNSISNRSPVVIPSQPMGSPIINRNIPNPQDPMSNVLLTPIAPFYWSNKIKEENEKVGSEKDKKVISTDLLLYEQIAYRDANNYKLFNRDNIQFQTSEYEHYMAKALRFYSGIKTKRMHSIKYATEANVTTNTLNIWGDGYQGYGNGFTNGKTDVLYPKQRKKVSFLDDLYHSRDDILNQSKQTEELIPIRLDFDSEKDKFRLRDTFTWNKNENLFSLKDFVIQTLADYQFPRGMFTESVLQSVNQQVSDYTPAPNFQNQELVDAHDIRILIKLDITVSNHRLVDQFEWDLLSKDNNPEEFAEVMCAELELPGEFLTAIAHCIREQCQMYYKALYLIGYNFDGSPITDDEVRPRILPPINNSTWLRNNDQDLENEENDNSNNMMLKTLNEFTPQVHELTYLDLEKLDKDRERELRRKRRNNVRFNRRGGPNLPELAVVPKTFRTAVPSTVLPGGMDLGPSVEGYIEYYEKVDEAFMKMITPEDIKKASSANGANRVRVQHIPGQKFLVKINMRR